MSAFKVHRRKITAGLYVPVLPVIQACAVEGGHFSNHCSLRHLIFLDPDPDQVATDVVPLDEPKQADLAGKG